jgi:hypothetical protein
MAGTIVTDRIESDASYASSITVASPLVVSNTFAIPSGSASAPAISPTGDTNTGIFFPAADTIAFSEGGVEAARFDSSGNLGIGTTTPFSSNGKNLEIANATVSRLLLNQTGTRRWSFGAGSNAINIFDETADAERLKIDASGRVTMPAQPSFKVGRSAGNVAASATVLIFNDIQTNIGSGYNSGTGRFTAPVTGNYFFTFSTCNAGGGYMEGNIHINGGQALNGRTTGADVNSDSYTISGVLRLSVNDYVEVITNTGTHYGGSEKICYFTGFLIG